jgi:hypothetical protein
MASTNYDLPDGAPFDELGNWTPSWLQWLARTHRAALSVQRSGTTAQRPTEVLWIGLFYFDTTLNKPIWVKSVPAKPAAAVWIDSTGAAV